MTFILVHSAALSTRVKPAWNFPSIMAFARMSSSARMCFSSGDSLWNDQMVTINLTEPIIIWLKGKGTSHDCFVITNNRHRISLDTTKKPYWKTCLFQRAGRFDAIQWLRHDCNPEFLFITDTHLNGKPGGRSIVSVHFRNIYAIIKACLNDIYNDNHLIINYNMNFQYVDIFLNHFMCCPFSSITVPSRAGTTPLITFYTVSNRAPRFLTFLWLSARLQ